MGIFLYVGLALTKEKPFGKIIPGGKVSWLAISVIYQVVMKVVQMLPDGHRMKKEVDMALDTVSETMTPMHYHLREIIICTYRQVSFLTLARDGAPPH